MESCEIDVDDILLFEEVEQPKVYDLCVIDEHSYYVDAGKPILVHNSSKTFSVVQLLITIAENEAGKRISFVSHSLPHIKRGVYRDLKGILESWGKWQDENFSYTDFVYTFPNGSYIELFGLEDEGKARGPSRDILFVNEANLIKKALYDQLAIRTTGTIFLDWNPADFVSWVYTVADDPQNKCIRSTYLNNRTNLSESQIKLIEDFKSLPDDFMWKVYGLGQRGAAKEIIYTAWKVVDELPTGGDVFYGLDFGFTNPSALVKVVHYEGANYVQQMLFERGLTLNELVAKVRELVPNLATIYADAAEPRSIEELYRAGLNVHAAQKDVWAGIMAVKGYPLYVHRDSKDLQAELMSYKWKKDKNDNVLEEPVKENDHLCDALRYGIFTRLSTPKLTWGIK
jgi:phage terminase large subunit